MTAPARAQTRSSASHVVVRDLADDDLGATAALHAGAPHTSRLGVPTGLGAGFLRRWQQAHLASPHATALVAERVDDVAGFLLAVTDQHAHRDHLLRHHGLPLAVAGAAASLHDPGAVRRWARLRTGPLVQAVTLLPTRGGAAAGAGRVVRTVDAPVALVAVDAVVVDPRRRGSGVGRQLLTALAERAAGTGAERVEARVPWGSGAEGFFAACGWRAAPTRPSPSGGFETVFHLGL